MSKFTKRVSDDVMVRLNKDHSWIDISSDVENTSVPLELEELKPLIIALQEVQKHLEEEEQEG